MHLFFQLCQGGRQEKLGWLGKLEAQVCFRPNRRETYSCYNQLSEDIQGVSKKVDNFDTALNLAKRLEV